MNAKPLILLQNALAADGFIYNSDKYLNVMPLTYYVCLNF